MHERLRQVRLSVLLAVPFAVVTACGGNDQGKAGDTATAAVPPTTAGSTGTAGTAGGTGGPTPGAPPEGATAAMVALGDSIFHGQAASGTCFTCHGADAKGTPLAPPLVQHQWLTGDGSYAFIQKRVTEGMPQPTAPYTAPMLPMGGVQLSADQIKAVAAYVYAISHP